MPALWCDLGLTLSLLRFCNLRCGQLSGLMSMLELLCLLSLPIAALLMGTRICNGRLLVDVVIPVCDVSAFICSACLALHSSLWVLQTRNPLPSLVPAATSQAK